MANVIICDNEPEYTKAFAGFLTKKRELDLHIYACDNLEQVHKICETVTANFIFLSEDIPISKRRQINCDKRFVFIESSDKQCEEDEIAIYRYHKMDIILDTILSHTSISPANTGLGKALRKEKVCKVIGVFSPSGKKTAASYAVKLGKTLGKKSNVLFLSTQIYGRSANIIIRENDKTIIDLVYYFRQENTDISKFISSIVRNHEGMDFILPAAVSTDIKGITACEWLELLQAVVRECYYETIIFDMGESMQGLYEVMKSCREIYIPYREDKYSRDAVAAFEHELILLEEKEILSSMKRKECKRNE